MVPSGRVIGASDEECFADELIKMSHSHFALQGARMTRVVKIAHAGKALARRQELQKEAISLGGVKNFFTAAAGAASRLKPRAGAIASDIGAGVRSAASKVRGAVGGIKTPGAAAGAAAPRPRAPTPKPSAPAPGAAAPKPQVNIPQPTTGGVTARPIHQVGPTPQAAPRPQAAPAPQPQATPRPQAGPTPQASPKPTPQQPPMSPAAQGAAAPKPGFMGRIFGGAKKVVQGGTQGAGAIAEGATKGDKALNVAGRLAAGVFGQAPDTASALGSSALMYGGSKLLGKVKNVAANRAMNKQVGKAIRGTSKNVVRDAGVIGNMGLKNLGQEGIEAAANIGMSPRQLHAMDELASAGADMPRSARKKIERAAGVSFDEIQSMGGVDNVLRNRAAGAGAGRVAAGAANAAGGAGGLLSGATGTALKVGVPMLVGLGGSAAYSGMQNLAEKNRSAQYQYGSSASPLNYSPTSMFPAGQVMY